MLLTHISWLILPEPHVVNNEVEETIFLFMVMADIENNSFRLCCQQIELSGFVGHALSALYRSGKLLQSMTSAAFLRKWRAADLRCIFLSLFVFFQFSLCVIISHLSRAVKNSQ